MAYKIIPEFTAADEGKTYILKQWFSYIDENDKEQTYAPGTPITIIKARSSGGFPEVSFDNEPGIVITTSNPWQVDDGAISDPLDVYSSMTTEELFKKNTFSEIIKRYKNSPFYTNYGPTTFNLNELLRLITESITLGEEVSYADDGAPLCISELPVDILFKTLNYCCAIDNLNQKVIQAVISRQKEIVITAGNQILKLKPVKEIPIKRLTPGSNAQLATTAATLISYEDLPHTYLSDLNSPDNINDIPCLLTRIIFEDTDNALNNSSNYYAFTYIIKYREIVLKALAGEPIKNILVDQYVFNKFKEEQYYKPSLVSSKDVLDSLLKSKYAYPKTLSSFNIANILRTEL